MKGRRLETGEPAEYRFFSEDLALGLVAAAAAATAEPAEAPPLAPGASEKTLYVRGRPADRCLQTGGAQLYAEAAGNQGFLAPGFAAAR